MKKVILKISLFILAFMVSISFANAEEININAIKDKEWKNLVIAGQTLQAGYYRLESDYYFDKQITSNLSSNQNIYIDLNGHNLTYGGWANWEDEEKNIPAKYKGSVNAAFYGTHGNIYFFDSTGNNTEINIDFSLVDGFDNVVIQGISYNPSAWRNMIITNNLELYNASINDKNHSGAATINITGNLIIKNSDLKVQSIYYGTNLDIINSNIKSYTLTDYTLKYINAGAINISDSDINSDGFNVIASKEKGAPASSLKMSNSNVIINTDVEETKNISIYVSSLEIVDSTLDKISYIEIAQNDETDNKIINSNINFIVREFSAIYATSSIISNLLVEDSEITANTSGIFKNLDKIVFKDSSVKTVNVANYYGGIAEIGAIFWDFLSLTVENGEFDTEGAFAKSVDESEHSVSIKNSHIKALSTNNAFSFLIVPGHILDIYDTVIETKDRINAMPGIHAKTATLNKVTYNGSTIHVTGDLTIRSSDIRISSMSGQAYFNISGNLDIDDSNIRTDDDPTKFNTFFDIKGTARITNSEIATRGKAFNTNTRKGTQETYVKNDFYMENVNYYGGVLRLDKGAVIKNSDFNIVPGGGTVLLIVANNLEANDVSIVVDADPATTNDVVTVLGDAILKNVKIRARKEGSVAKYEYTNFSKTVQELMVDGRSEMENVEFYGGSVRLGGGGIIKSSTFNLIQEDSTNLFGLGGSFEIYDTTITRLGISISTSPTVFHSMGKIKMKNVDIIMEDVNKLYDDSYKIDFEKSGIYLTDDAVLENVSFDGGAVFCNKNLVIKNSNLRARTDLYSAVLAPTATIEDSTIELNVRDSKDAPLFTGTVNLKNFTGKTNTNVAIATKAHLSGNICLDSAGDFDIYMNKFGDITLEKDVMITCEVGIFNDDIEKDITLPVIHLDFDTTVEEFKAHTMNFVNPYHDEYMLRYEASDNNLYWDLKQKITFVDRTMSDVKYFFKNEHISKEDAITYSKDGKTYEFVGWFENPDGTGRQFISGESVEEDELVYYAVWKEVDNPVTGFKSVLYFLIGMSALFIVIMILKHKKNFIYKI